MRDIVLIAHNLRSCHNVGSLLRTAEGLGIRKVYLTGYTPYPKQLHDARLPHIAVKVDKQIHKTALGAERFVNWKHEIDVFKVLTSLSLKSYELAALEQSDRSLAITSWQLPQKIALIVGRETEGLEKSVLDFCPTVLEIPMYGKKESFNVVQAAAMGLFHCVFSKS